MATACEKGGQETIHMGRKHSGIYEVEAVGQLAKRCRAQRGSNQRLSLYTFAVGR